MNLRMSVFCRARLLRSKECTTTQAIDFLGTFSRENPECSAVIANQLSLALTALQRAEGLPSTPSQLSILKGSGSEKKRKKSKQSKLAAGSISQSIKGTIKKKKKKKKRSTKKEGA